MNQSSCNSRILVSNGLTGLTGSIQLHLQSFWYNQSWNLQETAAFNRRKPAAGPEGGGLLLVEEEEGGTEGGGHAEDVNEEMSCHEPIRRQDPVRWSRLYPAASAYSSVAKMILTVSRSCPDPVLWPEAEPELLLSHLGLGLKAWFQPAAPPAGPDRPGLAGFQLQKPLTPV